MTPVKISFSRLDPLKWNALVEDQEGKVSFYDWTLLDSMQRIDGDTEFIALVLEAEGKYLLALPGREQKDIFSNLFFRTFDNLDMLISRKATLQQRSEFVQFIHNTYEGIILRNFNSRSLLFDFPGKYLAGPSRKCPYMELPEHFGEIFPMINKSFKKTLRWNMNGLPKLGITTEVLTGNNVQDVFEREFMPAHSARMQEKNIRSGFVDKEVQEFFRELNVHAHSGAILTVARLNGNFVGGIYGTHNRQAYSYIASGIRSDIEKFSIGQFLICKTMEFLISRQCSRFDFLRGTESYKAFWTKKFEPNESRYYYNASRVMPVFKVFLDDNQKRYGRFKCLKLLFQSWAQRVQKAQ